MYAETYERIGEFRWNDRVELTVTLAKKQARQKAILRWKLQLGGPQTPGRRTVDAIRSCLQEWIDRARGGLLFPLAQVLTGHGCIGDYLCRIERERTARCHYCAAGRNSAQHTLAECPAWADQRGALVSVVGAYLSLPAVVRAMVASEQKLKEVSSFCDQVMRQKEDAGR
ncbi:PREDICTED: uncharacterized protein LOC106751254, partial [Dinoponera quadriceps]|uniref:Uncharacterized protein LOC106751254 n=1 Tax=Dinoponera quadriceps TaxID=609295 RepID=A0A6P3YCI5_DINQU